MERPFEASIILSSFDNSDVLGVGIFPSHLIVNIHPTSAHTFDLDCSAIHIDLVSVDSGDGHFGGSVSGPPLDQ